MKQLIVHQDYLPELLAHLEVRLRLIILHTVQQVVELLQQVSLQLRLIILHIVQQVVDLRIQVSLQLQYTQLL